MTRKAQNIGKAEKRTIEPVSKSNVPDITVITLFFPVPQRPSSIKRPPAIPAAAAAFVNWIRT